MNCKEKIPIGGSSTKATTTVSRGWFPRQSGRAEFTHDPMERNSNPFLQKVSSLWWCGVFETAYSKRQSDFKTFLSSDSEKGFHMRP